MKKSLSQEHIQKISFETGIEPAFVEKDWYAVQLIASLAKHENDRDVQIVFSGGTSLSKGFNLIQRFSEDLDFVLVTPDGKLLSQGQRRAFRRDVIKHITEDIRFSVNNDDVQRGDGHRFFKAPVTYTQLYNQEFLRNFLQLEMTFFVPQLSAELRQVQSIVSAVMGEEPETSILCVPPLQTAGDKLSALTWRVVVRNRDAMNDDPTLVRHLHDLAALEETIKNQKRLFAKTARQSLEQDQVSRGGDTNKNLSVEDRLQQALKLLKADSLYRKEYEQFVLDMSYADEDDRVDFDEAYSALERIINTYNLS